MVSRLEALRKAKKDEDFQPPMPPADRCGYLLGYLFEVGTAMPGAAGLVPLSSHELAAWQELTSIRLQPWEARFLRRLSREYVSEYAAAEKRDRKAPWQEPGDATALIIVAHSLRDSFLRMAEI